MKEAKVNQTALARELGVVQSVVSDWVNGKLESWTDYLPQISRRLSRPPGFFLGHIEASEELPEVPSDLPSLVVVPEYDVRLSAGGGFIVDRETTRRTWTLPRWLLQDHLNVPLDRVTIQEVVGDSMSPTLESGDYVLIDLADKRIGLPGIFAVWDGDALVCKRIERIPGEDPAEVRIKSDNPHHGEYRVLADRVSIVGRVRWFTRRM